MYYKVGPTAMLYPTTVWVVILLVLFLAECAVMLALPLILPTEPAPLFAAFLDAVTITALVAPIIWWTLVRPMREVIRLRSLFLGDLFEAIEVERRQTAHDLHDGIGQELSLLISGLRSAHALLDDPTQATRCSDLQNLAQKALAEVRRISRGLRPSLLDDLGLVAAVEKVVDDFREHAPFAIALTTHGLAGAAVADVVKTAVFRIFQEALANVVRHARAAHVVVDLRREGSEIVLSVADDGQGFDVNGAFDRREAGRHFGLVGMRERAALLGGSFELDTAPGAGCRVVARLPFGERKDG